MDYKLIRWNQSNYEIQLFLTEEDVKKFREKILKDFQKDLEIPWFRKWHVPLNIVERFVKPEYIEVGIYEYAINEWIKMVMEKNPNIKFIWDIYDLNKKEENGKTVLVFKLDVYPEVEVLNENWKTVKVKKINDNVSEVELNDVLKQLQIQYAEYKDTDIITENSVTKVKLKFKNKKGEVIEEWIAFIGPEDFEEFKILKDHLIGVKKNQEVEIKYSKKDLPPHLQIKDSKKRPAVLVLIPVDIKERVLPEWTDENVKKYFGEELKTKQELIEKIRDEIRKVKKEQQLVQNIEEVLNKVQESFKVEIPKTIIDEEIKARLKSLAERFGGEEGLQKYLENIWEENVKKLYEDISNASKDSLKKFFIFKKLTELLDVEKDIDWDKPLDAEQKLYDKLASN